MLLRDKTTWWQHWPKIQNPEIFRILDKPSRFLTVRFVLRHNFFFLFCLLQNAILKYNASNAKKWDFSALRVYCIQVTNINNYLLDCVAQIVFVLRSH